MADPGATAVESFSGHPTWWDYGMFVGAFMQGDLKKGRDCSESLRTTASNRPLPGRRADRRQDSGGQLASELQRAHSRISEIRRRSARDIRRRKYPADLTIGWLQALARRCIGTRADRIAAEDLSSRLVLH